MSLVELTSKGGAGLGAKGDAKSIEQACASEHKTSENSGGQAIWEGQVGGSLKQTPCKSNVTSR